MGSPGSPRTALAALLFGLGVLSAGASASAAAPRAAHAAPPASAGTQRFADWVKASGDSHGLPFVIIDKVAAEVFVYYPDGRFRGASPVLIGLARGDVSAPGIGQRKLSEIRPQDRTTPAGRFVASLGRDLGPEDIVWVDYDDAIGLHRVVTSNPKERRLQRLATASPRDKRITYGCINVPAKFYDTVVQPAFTGTNGVVYILPEVRPTAEVFPGYAAVARPTPSPPVADQTSGR